MTESPRSDRAETLTALLAANGQRLAQRVAIREKRLGIWHEVRWAGYADVVGRLARGLAALGLRRGERVAIIGENRPQWLYTELAAQSLGAVPAGLAPSAPADEITALLRRLRPVLVVVEGQEQVDRLLRARDALGDAAAVIYWDTRGMRASTDPLLRAFDDVLALGGSEGRLAELAAETRPDDVAMIVFTLGTDSEPRGVELTHANLLAAARGLLAVEPLREGDDFVSCAPPAWIGDRVWCTAVALTAGLTVNFPEAPATVAADLREIGPEVVAAPPLVWQRMRATVEGQLAGAGRLGRWCVRAAIPVAEDRRPRLPKPLADLLVYRPVRDRLGLLRARHCFTSGGPISPTTVWFFHTIGVPLRQLYGVTEAAGLVAVQRQVEDGSTTVGSPLPGLTVTCAADGEICLQGAAVARGYVDDAEADAAALADGWFHTGDIGRIEPDGEITLVERRARIARLAGGEQVEPRVIEDRLRRSPYVRDAIVLADGRDEPAALVALDTVAAAAWAERHGHTITAHADLVRLADVVALVREAVRAANESLPPSWRLGRVALIPHELTVESGELTSIGDLRRSVVLARNAALVAALDRDVGDGPVIVVGRAPAEVH